MNCAGFDSPRGSLPQLTTIFTLPLRLKTINKGMETRYCSHCETDKPLEDFNKKQRFCKICNREYQREHYQNNKAAYKKDSLNRKWQLRLNALLFLKEYTKDGCEKCGESDFEVLEFDHIDPSTKKHNIATMLGGGYSIKRIENELKKCQVLCANCHKRKTSKQQGWYKNLYEHLDK